MYRILKCYKALDIIEVIANSKWGADKTALLPLYRSLVRSKLDYGCMIYGSTRTSYLKALDAVHHQGLRLCLGAFRTSPTDSLYVGENDPPLDLRRLKLALQYIVKLKANIENPAFDGVFHPQYENLYDKNKECIKSIGFRIQKHIEDLNLHLDIIKPVLNSTIPPWKLIKPDVDTSLSELSEFKKNVINPLLFKQKVAEFKHSKQPTIDIYTDGSKD